MKFMSSHFEGHNEPSGGDVQQAAPHSQQIAQPDACGAADTKRWNKIEYHA